MYVPGRAERSALRSIDGMAHALRLVDLNKPLMKWHINKNVQLHHGKTESGMRVLRLSIQCQIQSPREMPDSGLQRRGA